MRTECCKAYLGTHDNVLVCRKCGQENPHLSHVIHLTHSITESSARTLIDFLEQSVDRIEDHLNAGGDNDDARDVYLPQIASALDLRRHVVTALNVDTTDHDPDCGKRVDTMHRLPTCEPCLEEQEQDDDRRKQS